MGSEELLLLTSVWEENQQLIEDPVEILAQQFLAAFVVLDSRYYTLSKLARIVFKLIELGLIILKEILNRLNEVHVPLLEIFRYEVGSNSRCWPVNSRHCWFDHITVERDASKSWWRFADHRYESRRRRQRTLSALQGKCAFKARWRFI